MSDQNREADQYPEFSASIKQRFAAVVGTGTPLFTTDVGDLFDIFLANLLEEARQHYTCNACRHFVNRYGGLVRISESGEINPTLWAHNDDVGQPFFAKSVAAMRNAVLGAKVTGVFLSGQAVLGQPITGEWEHMSVTLPARMVHTSLTKTAGQVMADRLQEYIMLTAALAEYPETIAIQAVALLKAEALYRSDKVLGVAEWFKALHERLEGTKNTRKQANVKWRAVATAPAGFCHVKSSMIGTLLDDLKDGMSIEAVTRRFAAKMAPANYMRAQSAPTEGNVEQAEKLVAELGITESLRRRYAQFDEIPHLLWRDRGAVRKAATPKVGGVFANVTPKGVSASGPAAMALPSAVMTWDKFQRTILPTAELIEAQVSNPNRLMALVTAADPSAPNILQWDNPFSWYYHGGIDGEIKRRVERAGGQYENNEIRCSLIWEGYTDLDLHCITPEGRQIYFGNKRVEHGWLDVDANGGHPTTTEPVENIRWGQGNAPRGTYRFFVHNFCERGKGTTPFKVELEVNGKAYTYHGVAGDTRFQTDVFKFNYAKGQHPDIASAGNYASDDAWSVPVNAFVKVKGITESPNQWGEAKVAHSGHHVFFLLEGCRDKSEGKGRGFFNEMLKADLREVRKTLEAYTANTPVEGADASDACGVGYSKDTPWGLVLQVTANNSTRFIQIDRWD